MHFIKKTKDKKQKTNKQDCVLKCTCVYVSLFVKDLYKLSFSFWNLLDYCPYFRKIVLLLFQYLKYFSFTEDL